MRTHDEIEARRAEIEALDKATMSEEELRSVSEELETLINEDNELRAAAKAAQEQRDAAAAKTNPTIIGKPAEKEHRTMEYNASSVEYRTGFLKTMLGKELTEEERIATDYVATTGDTTHGAGYILPTTMLNEIWDLVEKRNPILGDITMYRTGTILAVPVRTSISQGDAKSVSENAANDDEINEFAVYTLNGKDFSKHFDLTYAMAKMSIEAFEEYLKNEIADRLGEALGKDVVTQILADYDDSNNELETAAVGETAFVDVANTFAVLANGKGGVVVYGSHKTIFQQLVGMVDDNGRPVFQVNANEGPAGFLIGAPVKEQAGITDGMLLIGYPKTVVGNMVQDIMVEDARDIKKHVITYSGYARFECKLAAPKAFATLTVKEQD